jgi:hypothetical protein
MAHYNIQQGDTLEHATVGDTFTNGYGEVWHIVSSSWRGSSWITANINGRQSWVSKYKKDKIVEGVTE